MARDIHSEVTARIIAKLSTGTVPWKQPWNSKSYGTSAPKNAVTNRPYSGVNTLLLWITADECGYQDNRWLTFKQALEMKGNVRKGEKSTQIIFVSFLDKINDKGKLEKVAFLKTYNVFNVAQCEGINFDTAQIKPTNQDERDNTIDEFLVATGADIRYGEARAYYTTAGDYINVPNFQSFKNADHFYCTTFHETVHWSGAAHRLNRTFGKRFGDQAYSMEELVAELGAGFLCAEFGINNEESNAGYIAHWIKFLTDNPKALTSAASAASKAVEYLRDTVIIEQPELAMAA